MFMGTQRSSQWGGKAVGKGTKHGSDVLQKTTWEYPRGGDRRGRGGITARHMACKEVSNILSERSGREAHVVSGVSVQVARMACV